MGTDIAKAPPKFSILRVLVLFLAGVCFLLVSIILHIRALEPVEREALIKRSCVRLSEKIPSLAHQFAACNRVYPGSVGQYSCSPEYFPTGHYCRSPSMETGCVAQYYITAVNPDSSVECSCRISCDQTPPFVNGAVLHPGKKK